MWGSGNSSGSCSPLALSFLTEGNEELPKHIPIISTLIFSNFKCQGTLI